MNLISRERCPICSAQSKEIGTARTLNPDSPLAVGLLACVACGHWWHTPVPAQDELLRLYRDQSPFVVTPNAQENYQQREHRIHEDDFLGYMNRFVDGGPESAYLEIGAGGGQMVREFRRRGAAAYGVEPAGWNPQEGIVEAMAELPSGLQFDIIVLQDVLEHLFDPRQMLAGLHEYAAEGATLFGSVPCSDSRPARRYGARWSMILPFGHLHYYSIESARETLRQSGWELLHVRRARSVRMGRLVAQLRLRELAYGLLKGGRDQLYFCATQSRS
jgi:SAM-dependent methyltransferase